MQEKIKKIITDCKISAVGFCDFDEVSDKLLECRAKMRLPENSKTVILCLFPFKVEEEKPLNISRYAAVPDYHKVCGNYLSEAAKRLKLEFPDNKFEYFIDNSPINEVYAAAAAGLGKRGDNGLLITKRWGSFVFIGEIVTDLYVECENKFSRCSGCGACKRACPVGLCKDNCLSKLSQKKGELSESEAELLRKNNIVWGCDICMDVCPENKNAEKTAIAEFSAKYRREFKAFEDITDRAFEWRGEKTVNRNFKIVNQKE